MKSHAGRHGPHYSQYGGCPSAKVTRDVPACVVKRHHVRGTASLADFEEFVKTKFRGTYILFVRLPEWQKNQIWQEYLETGDLGGIRTNIYAARQGKSPTQKRDSITNLPFDF